MRLSQASNALDQVRSQPARRVVLLGASNLTKGIGTVVETAYRAWGRPLEVFTALGHGRSFGRASSLLGRQLPGILECGLWDILARSPSVPTASLVTDIGNDLLYEEPVEQISRWVEECFDRLAAAQARTVVTLLPVENIATLSRARFHLLRTVFFPHSRIRLEEVAERAQALNDRIRQLAAERAFAVVPQRTTWYGFDPIHIRLRHRPHAWREILRPWSQPVEPAPATRNSVARTLYLVSRTPERRRFLGFEQRRCQPAGHLSDGTTVAIF